MRSEARQVEVEMEGELSGQGAGLYPWPWAGPDSRLHPLLWRAITCSPLMAHSSWHKPLSWATAPQGPVLPPANLLCSQDLPQ